ncbi:hypothetical protein SDC9_113572 [bioreactor metagenome]|uniref:Uncharacterized protein n=1 Tax=bioreactor metagenome TaxID=1076179 RepID=A0A645BNB8_9ZZZZ
MTVGAPGVEREKCSQYAESQEGKREPDALLFEGDVMQSCNLQQVHGARSAAEVDSQNTDEQEGGTSH